MNGRATRLPAGRSSRLWVHCAGCLLAVQLAILTAPAAGAAVLPGADSTRAAADAAASYRSECAACHLAYPPDLLPEASWKRLMAGLPHHFGVDASLEPSARTAVESWLLPRAGSPGEAPSDGRITGTRWFRSEHAELPATVWKRPSIRSASNCNACHSRAEQGDFDEEHVHVPR